MHCADSHAPDQDVCHAGSSGRQYVAAVLKCREAETQSERHDEYLVIMEVEYEHIKQEREQLQYSESFSPR